MKKEFIDQNVATVAEFHAAFEHPILPQPRIPSEDRVKLRLTLLAEELQELVEALQNKDIIEVADALGDLQYVLSGAILEFGMGSIFNEIFQEVHRSNMSKACRDKTEADMTVSLHENKQGGEPCYIVEREGLFFVYRKRDNKTMKNINYSPVNLNAIVLTEML